MKAVKTYIHKNYKALHNNNMLLPWTWTLANKANDDDYDNVEGISPMQALGDCGCGCLDDAIYFGVVGCGSTHCGEGGGGLQGWGLGVSEVGGGRVLEKALPRVMVLRERFATGSGTLPEEENRRATPPTSQLWLRT